VKQHRVDEAAQLIGFIMSRWDMAGRPDIEGGIDMHIARELAAKGVIAARSIYEQFEKSVHGLLSAVEENPEFTTEAHAEYVASQLWGEYEVAQRKDNE